jgi:hypothetical protein
LFDEKPIIVPAVGFVNTEAVHWNVTGTVPDVGVLNVIEVVEPVQMKLLNGVATIVAIGSTVTATVKVLPIQPFDPVGVTVYVIVTGTVVGLVYTSVMFAAEPTGLGAPAGTLAALLDATVYV